jgi:hypothetical protein
VIPLIKPDSAVQTNGTTSNNQVVRSIPYNNKHSQQLDDDTQRITAPKTQKLQEARNTAPPDAELD